MTDRGFYCFDRPEAQAINRARMEHLLSLGLPLVDKRILEVGAGIGHLTCWLEEAGLHIWTTEVREANVVENMRRHPWRVDKGRHFVADVMKEDDHAMIPHPQVILCYGLLYHLPHPARGLCNLGLLGAGLIVVESIITPDAGIVLRQETEVGDCDQSVDRVGSRFSLGYLQRMIVAAGWPHVAVPKAQPDFHEFQSVPPYRIVVVGSKEPLEGL